MVFSALRPNSPFGSDVDPFSRSISATSSANNTPLNSPPSSPPFVRKDPITTSDPSFQPLTHAHTTGEVERGRSQHRETADGPVQLGPDGGPASPSIVNARIRFAPLPLIKPRSYSTGRNVYLTDAPDVADGTLGDGAERQYVRREADEDYLVDDCHDPALNDSDDDDAGKGIFGSWGASGGSGFKSRKEEDSGLGAKLLKPLTFGLGRKKSKRSPSADSRASGLSLSRTSSMESDAGKIGHDLSRVSSTASSNGGVPFKSSGVPLRKSSTWEPGEKRKPRPVYPSVAQKSRNPNRASISVVRSDPNAPAFNEWGTGPSVGSVGQAPTTDGEDGDDDGSGMAWIRKRRLQREAEAKAKAEAEANAAKEEQQDLVNASATTSTATSSPAVSGATTPTASANAPSGLTLQKPTLPVLVTSPASPSPNTESLAFEFDDLKDGPRSAPPTVDTFSESDKSTVRTKESRASTEPTSDDDEEDVSDSDSEDDDDEDGEKDDSDDLDEEELAAEEALAAAAKQSEAIKGTGQERFHSANHETKMLAVSSKDSSATMKARSASGRSQH